MKNKTFIKIAKLITDASDNIRKNKILEAIDALWQVSGILESEVKRKDRKKEEKSRTVTFETHLDLDSIFNNGYNEGYKASKSDYKVLEKENERLKETIEAQKAANTLNRLHVEELKKDKEALNKDPEYSFDEKCNVIQKTFGRFSIKQVDEIIAKVKASGICQIMVDNASANGKSKTIEVNYEDYCMTQNLNEKYETAVIRAQSLNDRLEGYQKRETKLHEELMNLKIAFHRLKDRYDIVPKKKIDIFNPLNWFVKDEESEDKIKAAKNEYYKLINETPIGKLSIDQIEDYLNIFTMKK